MFDSYGKMQSGLAKLDLRPPSQNVDHGRLNEGLLPPPDKGDNMEWQIEDPVWKASKILDQLERMEKSKAADATTNRGGFTTFGEIQSVPWLDKMTKDYCEQTLSEARAKNDVSAVVGWCLHLGQIAESLTGLLRWFVCLNSIGQCMTPTLYPHT